MFVIDIYSKYAWAVPLKDKKGITINNAFQQILDKSNRKPNKIWIDKSGEFYRRTLKSRLQDNDIEIYLTRNEEKSVVAERFIRIKFTNSWLRILKYKNIYAKGYTPNCSKEKFVIKKLKNICRGHMLLWSWGNGEKNFGTFFEK